MTDTKQTPTEHALSHQEPQTQTQTDIDIDIDIDVDIDIDIDLTHPVDNKDAIAALIWLPFAFDSSDSVTRQSIQSICAEVRSYIAPGGHVFIGVPAQWGGVYTDIALRVVGWIESTNLTFREDIICEHTLNTKSNDMLEGPFSYLYIFSRDSSAKTKNNIYWNRSNEEKEANKIDLDDYQGEMSKNVWKLDSYNKIVDRIVTLYSYHDDLVLTLSPDSSYSNCIIEPLDTH